MLSSNVACKFRTDRKERNTRLHSSAFLRNEYIYASRGATKECCPSRKSDRNNFVHVLLYITLDFKTWCVRCGLAVYKMSQSDSWFSSSKSEIAIVSFPIIKKNHKFVQENSANFKKKLISSLTEFFEKKKTRNLLKLKWEYPVRS